MNAGSQAQLLARLETLDGAAEDKVRVAAWDCLSAMLNVLDSKISALLRFNAIVVAGAGLSRGGERHRSALLRTGGPPHAAICLGLVTRGGGRIGLCSAGRAGDHSLKRERSWPT